MSNSLLVIVYVLPSVLMIKLKDITFLTQDTDITDIYQLSRNWADLVKRARSKQLVSG